MLSLKNLQTVITLLNFEVEISESKTILRGGDRIST